MPGVNPLTGRPGPIAKPGRDGDKLQARARVNQLVRKGDLPHPNSLPCTDCGHVWAEGERRHEYDHPSGYVAEHHLTVESVCTRCHAKRDNPEASKDACVNGHAFTDENTGRKPNGTRFCRECRRAFDRNRKRPPGYWQAVNARRAKRNG